MFTTPWFKAFDVVIDTGIPFCLLIISISSEIRSHLLHFILLFTSFVLLLNVTVAMGEDPWKVKFTYDRRGRAHLPKGYLVREIFCFMSQILHALSIRSKNLVRHYFLCYLIVSSQCDGRPRFLCLCLYWDFQCILGGSWYTFLSTRKLHSNLCL